MYLFVLNNMLIISYIKTQKDTANYFKDEKDQLKYNEKEKITFHDTKQHKGISSRNKEG